MLRRVPRSISSATLGYRAEAATSVVHGDRSSSGGRPSATPRSIPTSVVHPDLSSIYGQRPSATSSSAFRSIPDHVTSRRSSLPVHLNSCRGIATGFTKQMISYANFDPSGLMKPKDYYREKKILHRVVNKLVTGSEGRKLVVVHDDTAYSIHSLTGLVVENQLNNISVAKALHLDNLRVHKKTGEYAFLVLDETNTQPLSPETEVEDFEALYAAIVELLKLTHGRDALTLLPPVFVDFLKKLLADSLNVQHIVAHALFLPLLSRVLLRLLLDLMLRRPLRTRYCPHREAITEMMNAMPYVDDNGAMLTSIVNQNDCLSSWQKRNAEDQQKWLAKDGVSGFPKEEAPQTELSGPLKVAGRLIGIQRDGVLHYKNTELPATLLQGIDLKKVVQMLNIEFPEFEQKNP